MFGNIKLIHTFTLLNNYYSMARLNQERQDALEPKRMQAAKDALTHIGMEIIYSDASRIDFLYKGAKVQFYPYSGWHTGKTIRDGRGLANLLNQLK